MGSKTQFRRFRCIFANKACRLFPCEAMHTCVSTTQDNTRLDTKRVYRNVCCRKNIGGDRWWRWSSGYHWPSPACLIDQSGLEVYFCLLWRTRQMWVQMSDTVHTTCRLRYRCYYSSFWTCFVSQLFARDIADTNQMFASPCVQSHCSNRTQYIYSKVKATSRPPGSRQRRLTCH